MRIIYPFIVIVALITGYGCKEKPKEKVVCKDAVLDTLISNKGSVAQKETVSSNKNTNLDTLNPKLQAKKGQVVDDKSILSESIESKDNEQKERLPKIVLIITSQACQCTLERCAEGEKIVKEVVRQFPQKLTFEKFDYAKEQASVVQLAKEYQLRFLPGLLFFDNKGTFNGKLEGSLDKVEVEKKLKELVVSTTGGIE